ncbi:mitochondrial import inner membrane translocase subunit TIM14 [Aplysia californica]|uniref:Mitochondrial import inner membrane translocase subunit TIM14 n=1 Tax=Aplysia californica TaxID=6500 RepID=A0ABM0JBY4_APLCA|nr:mitochondrial import inner membrane translocase subunit TIM14 [Aplysia californica]
MPTTEVEAFEEPQGREVKPRMATGLILAGLGIAVLGFGGRYALRAGKMASQTLNQTLGQLPEGAFSKYYRGGFESKMSKREAGLVLGVSPSASRTKIKEAHKRVMLLNHPDRGGSPYLAAKINEAKDYFDKAKPGSS